MKTLFAESIVIRLRPSWKFAWAVKKGIPYEQVSYFEWFPREVSQMKCTSIVSLEVRSSCRSSEIHVDGKSFNTASTGAPVFINTNSPLHLNIKIAYVDCRSVYLQSAALFLVLFNFHSRRTRSSHWFPPPEFWVSKLGLPYGWEAALDHQSKKYYIKYVCINLKGVITHKM